MTLPGYSDGDYPPWLQAEMGHHVPAMLIEEFGLRQSSAINGPFWEISIELEKPLVGRLTALGYVVNERRDWFFF